MVLKAYSFIVFIGTLTLFGVIIWFKLPETKNKSYEEIYRHFARGIREDDDVVRNFYIITCYIIQENN